MILNLCMHYFLSLTLSIMLLLVSVLPAGSKLPKSRINKDVLEEIRRARLTGSYGDLTGKPAAACDYSGRSSDQITRIIIHSTHVEPSLSFEEVVNHSLISCAFAHYYIDRDGVVIQRFSDLLVAPHTRSIEDSVNLSSIGIELYSTTVQERSRHPFTARQREALVRLTERLMNTYHVPPEQISRHADYSPLVDCSTIPANYKGNCRAYIDDHLDPYGWTDMDWSRFVSGFLPIEITRTGTGSGTIDCNGITGIKDRGPSGDCTGTFYIAGASGKAARLTLKATPDRDSSFTRWSGDCKGRKTCAVRMDSAKAVSAIFQKENKDTVISLAR